MTKKSPAPGHVPTFRDGRNAAKRRRRDDWKRLRAVHVKLTRDYEPHKRAPKRKRVLTLVLLNKGIMYRNHFNTRG